jgi:type IV secretory pathway VirJ component
MIRYAAALILLATSAFAGEPAQTLKFGRFGEVPVYAPPDDPVSAAILISSEAGWGIDEGALAEALTKAGAIVFGVDWKRFSKTLEHDSAPCSYPAADLSALGQYGQKLMGIKHFLLPILIGLDGGGAAVYPAFAQSPSDTFKGALGAGFCPTVKLDRPFCKGSQANLKGVPENGSITYPPIPAGLPNFVALNGYPGQACGANVVSAMIAATPQAREILLEPAGDRTAQIITAYRSIAGTETAFEKAQSSKFGTEPASVAPPAPGHVDISGLSDLPLTVVSARGNPKSFAIFLTGDGGWAGIDQGISATLAARGVEIVGFNTLDYFWNEKTPGQTAADLSRVLDAIRTAAPGASVQIIGYSYGAEIAPVVYPRLTDRSKAMIARMTLMVPGKLAVFAFSTSYWLGTKPSTGEDVEKAIRSERDNRVLCVYSEDDDGACPALKKDTPANVTLKVLGSGHHFGGNYDELAAIIGVED